MRAVLGALRKLAERMPAFVETVIYLLRAQAQRFAQPPTDFSVAAREAAEARLPQTAPRRQSDAATV